MKILLTNWINIAGVFVATFLSVFTFVLFNSGSILAALFGAFLSICLYGISFWMGFIIALIFLDAILIISGLNKLIFKLFIEWLLISAPFFYWAFKYSEWIFIAAIIGFLLSQLFRKKQLDKVRANLP
ncbi:MAG TPA: hypothetical protein VHB54_07200 [Mucilaginibacter sp.]|nr:hypothetical protein [Mucilaginibacter sp.]